MAEVFVSIGSNIDRRHNIAAGIRLLRESYGELRLSPVYETRAVGFDGDNFYNLVAGFETQDGVEAIAARLHEIEAACGRRRNGGPRFSSRTLDIDLLLYDDMVLDTPSLHLPRPEITEQAFVLRPLADLAGEHCHPVLRRRFRDLWQSFEHDETALWCIDFQP